MKIIVCIKEVIDPALSLEAGLNNSIVFKEGAPRRLNPADLSALALALNLKTAGAEIIATSIGEKRVEEYLRDALANGVDQAFRIWDEDCNELVPFQKALLLSSFAASMKADLVFTGSRSLDTGSGQVGPLVAALLGWPCIFGVTDVSMQKQNSLIFTKDIGKGEREKVSCYLPAVAAVKGNGTLPCASLDKTIESKTAAIPVFTLQDLGVTAETLRNTAYLSRLIFPQPAQAKVPPLDSSLPAFYRILQLLQGGISKRQGRIMEGDATQIAEQLYGILVEEGVLKKKG